MMKIKRQYLYAILCVIAMAFISIAFFYPDVVEGRVLQQHDIQQGIANGQEAKQYHELTGKTTRWTNSLFGGMPTFQISPSYASAPLLQWIAKAYSLWLPSPANLLFIMMVGFFIMGLCMRMRWYISLMGAVAWAFSTYFIIIIGAGHIWKFITLAYIPPTLGGIFLLYRGKYLAGTALASLFGALQLLGNHIQMSYYFLFVVAAIAVAMFIKAYREKDIKKWWVSTGCMVGTGIVALSANSASLYNTAQYSKETVRGRATYLSSSQTPARSGADFDFITQWSYGGDESLTLLIPNAKGGASIKPVGAANQRLGVMDAPAAEKSTLSYEEGQFANQFTQYFGNQPMTNGPVYVGIVIFLLALLSIPLCGKSPIVWSLWAVSLLAWLLSLGHNFEWFSRLFIDYFPGYNRFRAVSSILVIVEFTFPVLAMSSVKSLIERTRPEGKESLQPESVSSLNRTNLIYTSLLAFICLLAAFVPSIMGSGLSINETEALSEQGLLTDPLYSPIFSEVKRIRLAMVSADAWRSLFFLLLGSAAIWCFVKGYVRKPAIFGLVITFICLADLYPVDKRYVDTNNFADPEPSEDTFAMTEADREILRDKDPDYRVLDIDDFSGARSSYFHKTIGGYHAAKLTRYADLQSRQIEKNNMEVLNMLNTKYFLGTERDEQGRPVSDQLGIPQKVAQLNPEANGHAWFVNGITYVPDANAEMSVLDTLHTKKYAVADVSYEKILGKVQPDSLNSIKLTKYAPDRLEYRAYSPKGGIAVFSEIFFPWGWKATIDGKEAKIARANYVLRALRVPSGHHTIVFEFHPKSLDVTNDISIAAVVIIYLLCAGAMVKTFLAFRKRK